MASVVVWLLLVIFIIWVKSKGDSGNQQNRQNGQVPPNTPVYTGRPVQRTAQRTQQRTHQRAAQPRSTANAARTALAQPAYQNNGETKIEQRRKQQQAAADKSRIHQEIHKKELVEEKQKEWAKQVEATKGPARFEFEDSDLMAEVQDLIVCGYPSQLPNQRDFLAEGMDFLNRISSGEA